MTKLQSCHGKKAFKSFHLDIDDISKLLEAKSFKEYYFVFPVEEFGFELLFH